MKKHAMITLSALIAMAPLASAQAGGYKLSCGITKVSTPDKAGNVTAYLTASVEKIKLFENSKISFVSTKDAPCGSLSGVVIKALSSKGLSVGKLQKPSGCTVPFDKVKSCPIN